MNDFNCDQNAYGTEFKDHILEQYKLYVEMADRVSERPAIKSQAVLKKF